MNAYQNSKIGEVRLNDAYFAPRIAANHTNTLPANVRKCNDTTSLEAFRLDWKKGMPNHPHFFWDSDVAKVLEGMAYDLILNPDPEREKELNEYVDLVCSAQQPDGSTAPDISWKPPLHTGRRPGSATSSTACAATPTTSPASSGVSPDSSADTPDTKRLNLLSANSPTRPETKSISTSPSILSMNAEPNRTILQKRSNS